MTYTDALSRTDATTSSSMFDNVMSIAPAVCELGAVAGEWRADGGSFAPAAAPSVSEQDAVATEPAVPVAVTRRRVSDAATRVGRRSRLRAAHVEAVSRAEAEGRPLSVGVETNEFVAAMRADIARASLHSERPPLLRYVIRRWVSHRGATSATLGAATVN